MAGNPVFFAFTSDLQCVSAVPQRKFLKFPWDSPKTIPTGSQWACRPEGISWGAPVIVPAAMLALRSAFRRIK
jgi:hypothetical protein